MPSVRHSVSRWCFAQIPLPEFARAVRSLGLESIELLHPEEWAVVREYGLTCAMGNGPDSIAESMGRRENHARLVPAFAERIQLAAQAGVPSLVCFSGNRHGRSEEENLEACVEGYRQVIRLAERAGVTLCLELLNSKIDHPDYQADSTRWGVELCERVGSERFKLLYDIYHLQIMEGDLIRTIQAHHSHIGHYHTAGNPGRHELDDAQEINYGTVTRAIQATGFTGFIGHEFIPTRDPLASLQQAVRICTV